MAKPTRGLPNTFALNTKREDFEAPVEIGDFLDESFPAIASVPEKAAPVIKQPELGPTPDVVEESSSTLIPTAAPAHVPRREVESTRARPEEEREITRLPLPPRDRIQVNLSPEGRIAHDAVMEHFRRFCPREPNTKHNEVYQSLMIALHAVLQHYDLSTVPKRGAWGGATHRSFVTALKGAAIKAFGKYHAEEYRSP